MATPRERLEELRALDDPRSRLNQLRVLEEQEATEPTSIVDSFLEVVEPTIALGTGAAAAIPAGLAGISATLNPFAPEGAGAAMTEQVQEALTFQPRTEAGKQGLQNTLKSLQPLADFIDKFRTGDETLESGGGAFLATINEIAPEILGAIVGGAGVKGLGKTELPQVKTAPTGRLEPALDPAGQIKSKLVNKIDDIETAGVKLEKGKVVEDKLATNTIKQGFDEGVVALVKGASKKDKSNMKEMIDRTRKRKKDAKFSQRPSDIAGNALLERVLHVKSVNINAGTVLDRVAKTLKNKSNGF